MSPWPLGLASPPRLPCSGSNQSEQACTHAAVQRLDAHASMGKLISPFSRTPTGHGWRTSVATLRTRPCREAFELAPTAQTDDMLDPGSRQYRRSSSLLFTHLRQGAKDLERKIEPSCSALEVIPGKRALRSSHEQGSHAASTHPGREATISRSGAMATPAETKQTPRQVPNHLHR